MVSCTRHSHPPIAVSDSQQVDTLLSSPFVSRSTYLYKVKSDIYGHYLSGLLLIKPITERQYRIIFTTEVGVKLFDFELDKMDFIVHYCISKLNRKPVLSLLKNDFQLLLLPRTYHTNRKGTIEGDDVYQINNGNELNYYFINSSDRKYEKVESWSKGRKKKSTIIFDNYLEDVPSIIHIIHQNIKLKIELDLLKK